MENIILQCISLGYIFSIHQFASHTYIRLAKGEKYLQQAFKDDHYCAEYVTELTQWMLDNFKEKATVA
jgi:hypothetical protein